MTLYELEPAPDRHREDAVRPGPPYQIAAEKTLRLLGIKLEGEALDRAGMVFHYGLGIDRARASRCCGAPLA